MVVMVNFKTYEQATGDKAIALAKACEKVAQETGKEVIVIPQLVDLYRVAQSVSIPVYAQHVDEFEPGSNTGHVQIEAVKAAGAVGTIINHSEHRLPVQKVKDVVEKCKHKMLKVLVCAEGPEEVEQFTRLEPTYVAYEPPELIGGDISVSTAKPELITECVEKTQERGVPLIVGAGVKNGQDVRISKDLGAVGVLVASGVVKADDQETAVKDLCEGLNQ